MRCHHCRAVCAFPSPSDELLPHSQFHNDDEAIGVRTTNMLKSLLQPVTKRHVERRIVKTIPQHLYNIVSDVNRYSEFLPLCTSSEVLRTQDPYFDAALVVGLPPLFTEKFVSRVKVDPKELVIETTSIQSKLFDNLSSRWKLSHVPGNPNETDVDFWMEMTVSDPVVVTTLDQVLREIAGRQVSAFEQRCQVIPYEEDEVDLR